MRAILFASFCTIWERYEVTVSNVQQGAVSKCAKCTNNRRTSRSHTIGELSAKLTEGCQATNFDCNCNHFRQFDLLYGRCLVRSSFRHFHNYETAPSFLHDHSGLQAVCVLGGPVRHSRMGKGGARERAKLFAVRRKRRQTASGIF